MDDKGLLHIDQRQGHVAIDMGLMNERQVKDATMQMLVKNATLATPRSFGQVALELGYLDQEGLAAVEMEERRRRRLITGYEIIDIIGSGTIATVYHAMQLTMDREVALKILHPCLASDPVFVRAYIAEAQAVSRFHHPNIVQGFDAGESNGFFYFAHEYLLGGSIADRLARGEEETRFSEGRLLKYLRQTTAALMHAWNVAVYHGDINPGNLLLDANGNIKLANLGVPRVAGLRTSGGVAMPGFVRCGPEYAAPEQLDKPDLVNPQTDMYSLGATFYHISFGVQPFTAPEGVPLAEYRRTAQLPSFSLESQEGFSAKYLRLIHDMLEVDPAKRPANPEELADRLEKFHQSTSDDSSVPGQVRTGVVPTSSAVSGRTSGRFSKRAIAPNSQSPERAFSLKRRDGVGRASPTRRWLIGGVVAGLGAVLLWLLFVSRG
ncbi:MAG: serine/threonine protein kinase [Planctomycetaceae bacterium]|nr:serine/threonine protein kinase [Planctomycetaceae bacterium]